MSMRHTYIIPIMRVMVNQHGGDRRVLNPKFYFNTKAKPEKVQFFILFHRNPQAPVMSADSSQVGVALFPSK